MYDDHEFPILQLKVGRELSGSRISLANCHVCHFSFWVQEVQRGAAKKSRLRTKNTRSMNARMDA